MNKKSKQVSVSGDEVNCQALAFRSKIQNAINKELRERIVDEM